MPVFQRLSVCVCVCVCVCVYLDLLIGDAEDEDNLQGWTEHVMDTERSFIDHGLDWTLTRF